MAHIGSNIAGFHQNENIINKWNSVLDRLVATAEPIQIELTTAHKYKGDFYRLLNEKSNIDYRFWYPTLIINGLSSPLDFDGETTNLLTPNIRDLNKYYALFTKHMK